MSNIIVIFFFVGCLCFVFGIWGLVVVVLFGVLFYYFGSFFFLVMVCLVVVGWGFWVCECELSDKFGEDLLEIVIDEVVG